MDRRARERMKLDRRLIERHDWIGAKELEKELEALPDVADKAAPPEADEPAEAPAGEAPPLS